MGLASLEDTLHFKGAVLGLETLVSPLAFLQIGPTSSENAFGPYPGAPSHSFVPFIVSLFKNTFLFISAESFSSPAFSS